MTRTSHLNRFAFAILAALLVSGALFEALAHETAESQPAPNASIVELLEKRRLVLSQLVKVQTEAYRHGKATIEGIVQSHQELVQVELELATTHDERIKLLEESIELARVLEKIASARYQAAQSSKADVLKAQSATLKAETDILRERQRGENN